MAAYPDLPWMLDGTRVEREDGTQAARASNGKLVVRKLSAGEPRNFDLVHWLTDAQKTTLESFYQANKALDVTLTAKDDGANYTVRFAGAPQYDWRAVNFWVARVRLMEV